MDLQKADQFAWARLDQYGLQKLGWTFIFETRPFKRMGICDYRKKRIGITRWFVELNDEDVVYDVILHEIAHALAGSRAHHGDDWKIQCLRIGARPCARIEASSFNHLVQTWVAVCSGCGQLHKSHKPPKRGHTYQCTCDGGRTVQWLKGVPEVIYAHKKALKAAANIREASRDGGEIHQLLGQLVRTADTTHKQKIRARLRKLGHKGGTRPVRNLHRS